MSGKQARRNRKWHQYQNALERLKQLLAENAFLQLDEDPKAFGQWWDEVFQPLLDLEEFPVDKKILPRDTGWTPST